MLGLSVLLLKVKGRRQPLKLLWFCVGGFLLSGLWWRGARWVHGAGCWHPPMHTPVSLEVGSAMAYLLLCHICGALKFGTLVNL